MPTYIIKTADSDCDIQVAFNKVMSSGTESANSVSVTAPQGSNHHGQFVTPSGVPNNDDWETGVVTVEINVTTADMNMEMQLQVRRVQSGCIIEETKGFTANQTLGSTGIFTYTTASHNWAPGAVGDRIVIRLRFTTGAHGGATIVFETGTTDAEIVTLISEGGDPVSRRIFNIS